MTLSIDQFGEFFTAVYGEGVTPFPWQQKLMERVATEDAPWPDCLALPTSAGKTACIDIAIFALACQAEAPPKERTAPRRIFLVVDRRVIVDQAFRHAEKLCDKLHEALDGPSGILRETAEALCKVSASKEVPLTCHELRGGIYRDNAWAKTPSQACVIASTVDQIGSRLLFRGYGCSDFMTPIYAGLTGNDSLILLDEAHCAQPFLQTLNAVRLFRGDKWAEKPIKSPFYVVSLSATPAAGNSDVLHADKNSDFNHPVLGPRLKASKPTRLEVAKKAKGKNLHGELALVMIEHAAKLMDTELRVIAILVNRVKSAKQIHDLLTNPNELPAKLRNALPNEYETILAIGRMRPYDRDIVTKKLEAIQAGASAPRNVQKPLFVVATQCIEVGANYDFDGLVSECASLDALRQRFGRLNRSGRDIQARGVVVIRGDYLNEKNEDAIYGDRIFRTWEWLNANANEGEIDFGVLALGRILDAMNQDAVSQLCLQTDDAPVLLPSHIDLLSQTSPRPQPEPEIGLLLHGKEHRQTDVQVCWRNDLTQNDPNDTGLEEKLCEAVALCPPSASECLPTPLSVFFSWWNRAQDVDDDLSDVDSKIDTADSREDELAPPVPAVIWRGKYSERLNDPYGQLRPGDTVVLSTSVGGFEEFGHKLDESPSDIGDIVHLQSRNQAVLRLTDSSQFSPITENNRELLKQICSDPEWEFHWVEIKGALLDAAANSSIPSLDAIVEALGNNPKIKKHPFKGVVFMGPKRKPSQKWKLIETFTSEDDSSSLGDSISIRHHSNSVANLAEHYALNCGLASSMVEDLKLAGQLHDLGKADKRFQALLHGGYPIATDEPLAKSPAAPVTGKEYNVSKRRSGLPDGFRHELVSVHLIESHSALLQRANDPELVLHLVASHHGRCRPFAPVVDDNVPIKVVVDHDGLSLECCSATQLERVDSGVAERFWNLVNRYGWWGLAYLEAIFRLADHRQSELEQSRS